MAKRLRMLGIILAVIGIGFTIAGGVAYTITQDGATSLEKFSAAQNVELSYNDQGQLVDRGTVEGAQAIMELLTDDWGYPVVDSELDPQDPVVNTATEYMYQMATIGYHTLTGTQTVVLTDTVDYNGEVFEPGTYEVPVNGRYWTGFDRLHPLDGPARSQAWSGTTHGLFAELGVGTVTASALKLGLALAGLFAGIGITLLITGGTLIWATTAKEPTPTTTTQHQPATV